MDRSTGKHRGLASVASAALVCALAVVCVSPVAAKELAAYFGTDAGSGARGGEFAFPGAIAVNQSGAGPADRGDVYVVDGAMALQAGDRRHRLQRFGTDDHGTPGDSADDTYFFRSAWGADVDATPSGGSDYEVCTVAEECKPGVASGGNGTAAGNGGLDDPTGVAVDQDTGDVYVVDSGNHRVNVYDGVGEFLFSFGYDVVDSGPGDVTGGDETQTLTVKANGSHFSLAFRGKATGPRGTGHPQGGSNRIGEFVTTQGVFEVGQSISGLGIARGTTVAAIDSTSLTLSQPAVDSTVQRNPLFGNTFAHDVSAAALQAALNGLPSIGDVGGEVSVSGGPGDATGSSPYAIEFGGSLAGDDVPPLEVAEGLTLGGGGEPSATVEETAKGGAFEVCVAADGDVCRAGASGDGIGELADAAAIALSAPDGDAGTGTVFVADRANRRVSTYDLDGSSPDFFGSAAIFEAGFPNAVAVDEDGIVYADDAGNRGIERYDSQDARGTGVGFLAPMPTGGEEVQQIDVSATAGEFKVSFGGHTTPDLPYDVTAEALEDALLALPSIGASSVNVKAEPEGGEDPDPDVDTYTVVFEDALGALDVDELVVSDGSTPLSGGTGASVTTSTQGIPGLIPRLLNFQGTTAMAYDPSAGALHVLRETGEARIVQQFGPVNDPGLLVPPSEEDDRHGKAGPFVTVGAAGVGGLAVDEATGRLFVTAVGGGGQIAHGVYMLDTVGPSPTAVLDSVSGVTATSATVNATVNPNGPAPLSYYLEYSKDGGSTWLAGQRTLLGAQTTPQDVEAVLNPPPGGLEPNTEYLVRLVAQRPFYAAVVTDVETFTTSAAPPSVETVGAPVRDATSAQLLGRVDARGSATEFHFEYGDAGPCSEPGNGCASTPATDVGAANGLRLVAADVDGLEAGTEYHYRLVADNGTGGPQAGEDMTVTTRASDAPPSHGGYPGPPGSDRAWEQVNHPDTNSNPVGNLENTASPAMSDDGDRAIYGIQGGTEFSDTGTTFNQFFAQRTPAGWETKKIYPPRSELHGSSWLPPGGPSDLSAMFPMNVSGTGEGVAAYRLTPTGEPTMLYETTSAAFKTDAFYAAADDGSAMVLSLTGSHDPDHPVGGDGHFYEVASGTPRLVSILPDGTPACNATGGLPAAARRATRWVSGDGDFAFFHSTGASCSEASQLYVRDLAGEQTVKASEDGPVSGATCEERLIASTPGAAFFWTRSRLVAEDLKPTDCSGDARDGDVYRFDLDSHQLECVTCAGGGVPADVAAALDNGSDLGTTIGVASDGSRVYFKSPNRLVAGAHAPGLYRVEVASGDLAYVAPADAQTAVGTHGIVGRAMSPDGSAIVFRSAQALLDPVGGTDSDGKLQYFRYDDRDRSLVCVSCPRDGSAPAGEVPAMVTPVEQVGANSVPITADGDFAFATPTTLVASDENAAGPSEDVAVGTDLYEWRDGRLLLITDGATAWHPQGQPAVQGVTPDGRSVFFAAAARLTPDARDSYTKLYVARIGGGFDFPEPPEPCPIDGCPTPPVTPPALPVAATVTFSGSGNAAPAPPPLRVRITRLKLPVAGSRAKLRIRVPAAGRLLLRGPGTRTVRRATRRAGTVTLRVALTQRARRRLAHRRRLAQRVRLTYTPSQGGPTTTTLTLRFVTPRRTRR